MEDYELLAILKVIVMLVFMIIVIVFGTLPIRSKKFKKRPLLKAIGATFAGCLFLNVSIMHILPEAADTL
jgi:zinc transporter 1/2/3